jgi:hypothetical protein
VGVNCEFYTEKINDISLFIWCLITPFNKLL